LGLGQWLRVKIVASWNDLHGVADGFAITAVHLTLKTDLTIIWARDAAGFIPQVDPCGRSVTSALRCRSKVHAWRLFRSPGYRPSLHSL
jgi:hypothetical protein